MLNLTEKKLAMLEKFIDDRCEMYGLRNFMG